MAILQGWEMSGLPTPKSCALYIYRLHAATRFAPMNNQEQPTRASRKKGWKNTGAGRDLGVGEGEEARVEDVVRGQDEETQGETQTTRAWVSTAPERTKDEDKKTASANIPNKERRRRTKTVIQTQVGAWRPEGRNNRQHTNPWEKTTVTSRQKTTWITEQQTSTNPYKVPGECSLQGGGAHGPPCTLEESSKGTVATRVPKSPSPREPPPRCSAWHKTSIEQRPQECCPSTWPFLDSLTRQHRSKQTPIENLPDTKPRHKGATQLTVSPDIGHR